MGSKRVSWTKVYKGYENVRCLKHLSRVIWTTGMHRLTHQQALCGKYVTLSCVTETAASTADVTETSQLVLPHGSLMVSGRSCRNFLTWKPRVKFFWKRRSFSYHYYGTLYSVKLASAKDLIMLLSDCNLNLSGTTVLLWGTSTAVKLFQWQPAFASQVTPCSFTHFPCYQKPERGVRFPSPNSLQIYFLSLSYNFSSIFWTLMQVQWKLTYFKIHLTMQLRHPSNHQLEVINPQ